MREILIDEEINRLTYKVIGICIDILKEMGPGFPEEYYQKALEYEFNRNSMVNTPQKAIPMFYKDMEVGTNFLDFLVEDKLIVEIKSVSSLNDVHRSQVIKYFACSDYNIALLVNFGRAKLEHERMIPPKKIQDHRGIIIKF